MLHHKIIQWIEIHREILQLIETYDGILYQIENVLTAEKSGIP